MIPRIRSRWIISVFSSLSFFIDQEVYYCWIYEYMNTCLINISLELVKIFFFVSC